MSFRALLEKWQSQPAVTKTPAQYQIRLDVDDAARVEALADLFPGIDAETVIADLLSAALNATEAAMPYEPGDEAVAQDASSGSFAAVARAIEAELARAKGTPVPMNIDGATAVIYAELGFPAPLARGLFCLSRSVGILAHAHEQMEQGGRNKGPTPPEHRWTYTGPNPISEDDA